MDNQGRILRYTHARCLHNRQRVGEAKEVKRWFLLENNTALRQPGWLPPPAVWPELAPLRAEHERLLAVAHEEAAALMELRKQHEGEDEDRAVAIKAAFLSGGDPGKDGRQTEDERKTDLADAKLRVEAATDALVTFLVEAIAEIEGRAPEWYATLVSRRAEAEVKCEEARRLLAEADAVVGEADRMRAWLDRESGQSALGHYPYEQMGPPDPANVSPLAAATA